MNVFIFLAVITTFAGAGLNFMLRNLLYICQPSEVLIFAGPKRRLSSGRVVGYRLVKGGKSLRTPLFERAFRMDLTNTIIELKVVNAYSKGGVPLSVEGIANIKVAGEEPIIHNAIERLLGKSRKQIEQIARETLEGNLRGVLASLTPQQVNEDKMAFARSLLEEASEDLEKMGLTLDNLQIQNIWDDVGYLDSIGRKQQADLQRDARIAEAENRSESVVKSAENDRNTALKRLESEIAIVQSQAEQRIQDALTKREALVAEAESIVGSQIARTESEVGVQQARIKQVQQQLQADVLAPADAACKRMLSEARGDAARIIEDGKARAEGIRELAKSWSASGDKAREVFLLQKLDVLLDTLVSTVPEVEVENVTLIDTQGGGLGTQLAAFSEQLKRTTGIDLPGAVNRLGKTSRAPRPLQASAVSAPLTPGAVQPPSPPPVPTMPVATVPPIASSPPPKIEEEEYFDDFESLDIAEEALLPDSAESAPPAFDFDRLRQQMEDILDRLVLSGATMAEAEASLRQTIQQNPNLQRQLRNALQAGGREIIDQIFQHPLIRISSAAIAGWLEG